MRIDARRMFANNKSGRERNEEKGFSGSRQQPTKLQMILSRPFCEDRGDQVPCMFCCGWKSFPKNLTADMKNLRCRVSRRVDWKGTRGHVSTVEPKITRSDQLEPMLFIPISLSRHFLGSSTDFSWFKLDCSISKRCP
jgi:hypothetical protein